MVKIEGDTKVEIMKNDQTNKVFFAGIVLLIVAGIGGILYSHRDSGRSLRIPQQGVRPLGDDSSGIYDKFLVYSQAGDQPVLVETPVPQMCTICQRGDCQTIKCWNNAVVSVCKGGYIIKLQDGWNTAVAEAEARVGK